jgi:hypothetical protein
MMRIESASSRCRWVKVVLMPGDGSSYDGSSRLAQH